MNQILAELKVLPKLVYGKVAVIDTTTNTYRLLKPSINTSIQDDFDPMNYSILKHPKYAECIVYSTRKEREKHLVHKQLKDAITASAASVKPKQKKLRVCLHCGHGELIDEFDLQNLWALNA